MRLNFKNYSSIQIPFEKAFEDFLIWKKSQNISNETVKYYEECVKYFGKFIDLSTYCNEINSKTIISFINYQKGQALKYSTINTRLRAIRAILYYCMKMEYTEKFEISLLRVDKEVKVTYTDRELEILLKKPNIKKCNFSEYRNWVVTNFLFATGSRLKTTCNLLIGDIDLPNQLITLRIIKNRKAQLIPIR